MDKSPINKRARSIRSDANTNQRKVLALQSAGLSQRAIARKTGLDVKTVNRHAKAIREELNATRNIVDDVSDELAKLQSPADIARNIVELSTKAKMESVRDSMTKYSIEVRGGVTEKERQRSKNQADPAGNRPIFVFQGGMNIDFGGAPTPQDMVSDSTIIEHGAVSDSNIDPKSNG